jgi:hypothetical protein
VTSNPPSSLPSFAIGSSSASLGWASGGVKGMDCKLKETESVFLQVKWGSMIAATFDPSDRVGFKLVF